MESNQTLVLEITDESNSKTDIDLGDVAKVFILSVLSFGLYSIWWKMQWMWTQLITKTLHSRSIVFLTIVAGVALHIGQTIAAFQQHPLFAGQLVFSLASRLPEPYWLISVVSSFFILAPANALNFAIANSGQYNATTISGFNGRQIAVLVIGGIFWMLVLGLFPAPENQY